MAVRVVAVVDPVVPVAAVPDRVAAVVARPLVVRAARAEGDRVPGVRAMAVARAVPPVAVAAVVGAGSRAVAVVATR